jgi:hypothetical protein
MTYSKCLSAAAGTAAAIAMSLLLQDGVSAQGRGGNQPPAQGRPGAVFDFTGYWVAEVTEDWRWRMVTPTRGDWESVPMNAASEELAWKWDPKADTAAGQQCKSYGAAALMRTPTRLNITWQDDNTLKVDADYGQQTRLLHFGNWKSPGGEPTWQGESVARWEAPNGGQNFRPNVGTLKIVTTRMRPGYLRKNGIPYSANAVLTEYWDLIREPNGDTRILMLLEVNDPTYLSDRYVVPVHFKKEPDGSKWTPTPCSSEW